MALNALERATVLKAMRVAQKLLIEVKPYLDAMNIIYDSEGGVKSTITQQDLDDDETLSGLTKQQLDDGMWVLTATLRSDLQNGFFAISQLAERA